MEQIEVEIGSPASNGGRGLKRLRCARWWLCRCWFARQQWRARIETQKPGQALPTSKGSPASNVGRGLKQELNHGTNRSRDRFARQQWRARIETGHGRVCTMAASWFARQQWRARIETITVRHALLVSFEAHKPTITSVQSSEFGHHKFL